MNITQGYLPVSLPPSVTLDAVLDLGAALGRQAAAAFLADEAEGLQPGPRREAEGLTLAVLDDVEAAIATIERQARGAGDALAYGLREAMARWCLAAGGAEAEIQAVPD